METAIIDVLLFMGFIASLAYIYLTWNFSYWKKRGVKGETPRVIYGTNPSAINQKRNVIYDLMDHYKKFKNTEKFIGNYTMRTPELMILSPDLAREVLVTKFRKFMDNYFAYLFENSEPMFSLNPFLLKGQEWKDKRAEITPGLTIKRIQASYPVMQNVGAKFVNYIKEVNRKEGKEYVFDCNELTRRFTIQNVSDSVYGIDAGALDVNKKSEILITARELMDKLFNSVEKYIIFGSLPLVKYFFKPKFVSPKTEKFFENLMKDAVKLRQESNLSDRIDFLNYLLQLKEKKGLTDFQLQANAITFFLDGFDTSAAVLSHVILCLGRHKDVQDKLREEIQNVINEDGTVSFDKIIELPYLDQCINETLRVFSPAGFLQKMCVEDTELTNTDGTVLRVEKGVSVVVPIYCFHLDEQYFPNPEKFDPERFSADNGGERKYRELGVFLPFSDGPRTCLGQRFALTQIKVALFELVRNFEIIISDKTRKDNLLDAKSFLVTLDGGIWCSFRELKI